MTRRRRAVSLIGAIGLVLSTFLLAPPPSRAADPYTLSSAATYRVRPAAREITVTIELKFTNTTPDPEGQFSVFDELRLAIHDGATDVQASDADGPLDTTVAVNDDGVNVATVELRDGLRFDDSVTLDLDYTLADGADPQLRVRPSVVVFPAWSFGTSGRVTVDIPAGYEVRVDGDPLSERGETLTSGRIDEPTAWLALVTATRPASFSDATATVPLRGGTADLVIRSFDDDESWGTHLLELLTAALPRLEEAIGLPYPHVGRLVLTESVPSTSVGFAEESRTGTEIPVAFDQPDFTAIHQIAHVWLRPDLVEARWIREGLASHLAAVAAGDLDVDLPYDPAEAAKADADAAFPLDTWAPSADPDAEEYGYAASWSFMDELAHVVGADALRAVLVRVAASIGPYDGKEIVPDPTAQGGATPSTPLTTRGFLDQLEAVSDAEVSNLFAEQVLTDADVALLEPRANARAAFGALVAASGGWGAPDPVRSSMTSWAFDDALARIEAARAWLDDRDALLEAMEAADLSAPDRLQQAYRAYGGGPEATSELEAERAVVEAYASAAAEVNAPHGFLQRVGLIGGADPDDELALANGRFTDGNLRGALDAIAEAQRIMGTAESGGIVRLVSIGILVVVLGVAALILFRRRASYTAGQ